MMPLKTFPPPLPCDSIFGEISESREGDPFEGDVSERSFGDSILEKVAEEYFGGMDCATSSHGSFGENHFPVAFGGGNGEPKFAICILKSEAEVLGNFGPEEFCGEDFGGFGGPPPCVPMDATKAPLVPPTMSAPPSHDHPGATR